MLTRYIQKATYMTDNTPYTTQTITISIDEYKDLLTSKENSTTYSQKTAWQVLEDEVRHFFSSPTGKLRTINGNTIVHGLNCSMLFQTWRYMVTLKIGSYSKHFTIEDVAKAREIFEDMRKYIKK